jgi:hypothetical protein
VVCSPWFIEQYHAHTTHLSYILSIELSLSNTRSISISLSLSTTSSFYLHSPASLRCSKSGREGSGGGLWGLALDGGSGGGGGGVFDGFLLAASQEVGQVILTLPYTFSLVGKHAKQLLSACIMNDEDE